MGVLPSSSGRGALLVVLQVQLVRLWLGIEKLQKVAPYLLKCQARVDEHNGGSYS